MPNLTGWFNKLSPKSRSLVVHSFLGFEVSAMLVILFLLIINIGPLPGQDIEPRLMMEHRLTLDEGQTANLVDAVSKINAKMDVLTDRMFYITGGIIAILIKGMWALLLPNIQKIFLVAAPGPPPSARQDGENNPQRPQAS